MSDLISRLDALKPFCIAPDGTRIPEVDCDNFPVEFSVEFIKKHLLSLPSADRPTTDCTEFMEWLKAEVLDENNWELNAVAYGEIICRKLKKLGWIDVEDGFYVDTRPTGEWVDIDNYYRMATCSRCHKVTMFEKWGEYTRSYNYCPNCGADMRGEEE